MPVVPFVKYTVWIYLPMFSFSVFYQYVTNIPGLFLRADGKFDYLFKQDFGRKFIVPPIEIGGMVINLMFLIIMMGSKKDLQLQRNEFKHGMFKKLTDKQSNFLYQLFFYVLKRIHIPVLLTIFIFGI